jgi:hypothetical protein
MAVLHPRREEGSLSPRPGDALVGALICKDAHCRTTRSELLTAVADYTRGHGVFVDVF